MQKETRRNSAAGSTKPNPPRKLTRAEKKQIAEIIRQAKGDGKAHTAQQTIPYIQMYPDGVKAGDSIEIKEKCKGSERYKGILEVTGGRLVPNWLEADQENLKGVVKELPTREEIDVPVNEMLIVELYSK